MSLLSGFKWRKTGGESLPAAAAAGREPGHALAKVESTSLLF